MVALGCALLRGWLDPPASFWTTRGLFVFNKGGKRDFAVVSNLNAGRRSADAHCRDRRIDFHLAGLCDLASDESERSFGKAEKSRVGASVRGVNKFIQSDAGITRKIEGGTVEEDNADRALRSGLDHIAW